MKYYILSLKYRQGDSLMFWKPNHAGYTNVLELAGEYSAAEVRKKKDYLNNGYTTLAIPTTKVHEVAVSSVLTDDLDAFIKGKKNVVPSCYDCEIPAPKGTRFTIWWLCDKHSEARKRATQDPTDYNYPG